MVFVVNRGVEATIVAQLAHVVEQFVWLQVDTLGAEDLQGGVQWQALLVRAAPAGVGLVDLWRFF